MSRVMVVVGPLKPPNMWRAVLCTAVEVILAAPGKVPQEEKLYVQKATFGKVSPTARFVKEEERLLLSASCPCSANQALSGGLRGRGEAQNWWHRFVVQHRRCDVSPTPPSQQQKP